jgi:hypothetical protein
MADPSSQLDLPDDFNNLDVEANFCSGKQLREPEKQENEWRKPDTQKGLLNISHKKARIYPRRFQCQ